ncbi:MAG: nucleotide sugar dehydrogenase [Candidatus Heimdallarchaeota archaeon]|nr:nucleotide sugar dehydrogenase [Candidatus Heimdallarchaeota archaeon]
MQQWISTLSEKIAKKSVSISVIGLGYVGLPLVVKAGIHPDTKVYGLDLDQRKLNHLEDNHSYIEDISDEEIKTAKANNTIFLSDYETAILHSDISIICVPTPVDKHGVPDLKYIYLSVDAIGKELKKSGKKHIIILESTTYPTTTEVIMKEELEKFGLSLHEDFELCFSPERIDPGNRTYGVHNIPKILGATSDETQAVIKQFYETIVGMTIIEASSPRIAEFTKLFENIFRQVNIALVNELAVLAEKMQIDMFEVIKLASTKPFGFLAHYPGPGLGGHCIPVDPYYLLHISKEYKSSLKFIDIASTVNENMDNHVINLVSIALNRVKRPINGSTIAIFGYAYKPNVADLRNSPAIPISEKLLDLGAKVVVCDSHVEADEVPHEILKETEAMKVADLILIITPHDYFNFEDVLNNIGDEVPIVDTRGNIPNTRLRKIDVALGKAIKEFDV